MTPELLRFLWELCRAGNMAATPVMEDEVFAVASESVNGQEVAGRWLGAVVVGSPDELGRLLSSGLAAWQAVPDQVAGE